MICRCCHKHFTEDDIMDDDMFEGTDICPECYYSGDFMNDSEDLDEDDFDDEENEEDIINSELDDIVTQDTFSDLEDEDDDGIEFFDEDDIIDEDFEDEDDDDKD